MARNVLPAEMVYPPPGSHTELLGLHGAYTVYTTTGQIGTRALDVCCPGCGNHTYCLHPDRYQIVGPDDSPSCADPITFSCCGSTWDLSAGNWYQQREAWWRRWLGGA